MKTSRSFLSLALGGSLLALTLSPVASAGQNDRGGLFIGIYSGNPPPAVVYVHPSRPYSGHYRDNHRHNHRQGHGNSHRNGHRHGHRTGFRDGHHQGHRQGHYSAHRNDYRHGHRLYRPAPPSHGRAWIGRHQ